ncbi:hypothetical protein HGRIS_007261 [Hohenbuehelia grisea]|uniref:Uncharacterized protein n=1 Tax=Hohenbuehelia grisea TaxID=104357 RepID=A0ABR3JBY6_9AGAR
MSSFRNNRIIIASLFLPTTAVLGESVPPTPSHNPSPLSIPASAFRNAADKLGNAVASKIARVRSPSVTAPLVASMPGPLKSIVEDLQDKSRNVTPAALSPAQEIANPFSKVRIEAPARKHQTTHAHTHLEHAQPANRIQRKQSRSSSRRPTATSPVSPDSASLANSMSSSVFLEHPAVPSWHLEPNPHCNGGLKNAVLSLGSHRLRKKLWIGTLGSATDSFDAALRADIDKRMRDDADSVPVWIPDDEFESCYDEFCHQVLWPALHYAIPDAPKTKMFYESAAFRQYVAVNRRFADAIIENYKEGDIIWVNDYHLMLVPALLRASSVPFLSTSSTAAHPLSPSPTTRARSHSRPPLPPPTSTAPIGFFMHVAFPSSEIFRCLSVRRAILRGMLGADLVGFQTASYARHFRQTVSRILAFEALPKGIVVKEDEGGEGVRLGGQGRREEGVEAKAVDAAEEEDDEEDFEWRGARLAGVTGESGGRGRFVDVGVFPMGIDVAQLNVKKADPEVTEWMQVLKQRYAGMKMIVGRDKLDEIQGVRHKIQAFETFLERYPEFQQKVVLIQVALHTTESNELAGGVADVVSHINSRFSTLTYQPVVFLHTQDLTFSQYLALLSVADAFLVTSLREGMALRTHEFVECQEGRYRPLILSEFTGSYSYSGFRSCIAINPWDKRGTATAINQALTMSEGEMKSRWEDLHAHVTTQTAQAFVTSFLTRCLRAHTEHIHANNATTDSDDTPSLDMHRILPRWRHSPKRLVLVDLEGTLWLRDVSREGLVRGEFDVPEEVYRVLGRLVEERRNEVWVLSGLRKGMLEGLVERVPKVGIVAENGCFIKTRPTRGQPGTWINMVSNFNLTWKSACLEILHYVRLRLHLLSFRFVWFFVADFN